MGRVVLSSWLSFGRRKLLNLNNGQKKFFNASNELSKHWLFSHPVFFSSTIISANETTTKPSRQQVKLKTYEYYSSVVDFSWPRSMKLRSALLLSHVSQQRLFASTILIPIARCVGCCTRYTYWILPLKSKQSWEHTIEAHGWLLCIENHIRAYYRASQHKQYSNIYPNKATRRVKSRQTLSSAIVVSRCILPNWSAKFFFALSQQQRTPHFCKI